MLYRDLMFRRLKDLICRMFPKKTRRRQLVRTPVLSLSCVVSKPIWVAEFISDIIVDVFLFFYKFMFTISS